MVKADSTETKKKSERKRTPRAKKPVIDVPKQEPKEDALPIGSFENPDEDFVQDGFPPKEEPKPKVKTEGNARFITELAFEVVAGKWGEGDVRGSLVMAYGAEIADAVMEQRDAILDGTWF